MILCEVLKQAGIDIKGIGTDELIIKEAWGAFRYERYKSNPRIE